MRIVLPTILLLIVGLTVSAVFLLEAQEEIDRLEQHNLQYQAALEHGLNQSSDTTWSSVVLPSDTNHTTVTTKPDTVIKRDTVYMKQTVDTLSVQNRVAKCTSVLTPHENQISQQLRLTLRPITIRARDYQAAGVLRTRITSPLPVESVRSERSINPSHNSSVGAVTLTLSQGIQGVGYTHSVRSGIAVGGAIYRTGGDLVPALQLRYVP